ncbi:MAG: hypothetical protein K0S33_2892 [Bacteroidetes bacterium]|nr:hypothetical protein [Bacteroidota bacterium]
MNQYVFTIYFSLLLLAGKAIPKSIFPQLQKTKGLSITVKTHPDFKEYYEIKIDQPLDHSNSEKKKFRQTIHVGLNDVSAPVILMIEGYTFGKRYEPACFKNCNLVWVEHRYHGSSRPDSLQWEYLTIKQAANDLHRIRQTFGKILKGKWLSTGISKGGQTALAYKMYFPKDADATIAFVTPVKDQQNDKRMQDHLSSLAAKEESKIVFSFQNYAFRNKAKLLPEFDTYIKKTTYSFGSLDTETLFDYLLLEYPFAFFQNCNNYNLIPDTLNPSPDNIIGEIVSVVSPRFFSTAFRPKLEPSFYMFYHELGYYEYALSGMKQWLKNESYPNNIFAPEKYASTFDPGYLKQLNTFITSKKIGQVVFIYGETDPYTSLQAATEGNEKCLKLIVKNGCHKSRIEDLDQAQQKQLFEKLSQWLKWKF